MDRDARGRSESGTAVAAHGMVVALVCAIVLTVGWRVGEALDEMVPAEMDQHARTAFDTRPASATP